MLGVGVGRLGGVGQSQSMRLGVPAWADSAVMDADYENGRYVFDGRVYLTESDFNTARGVTKSGITRVTSTPYLDPALTNLLSNGAFTSDVSGWTAQGTGASIAWAAGELELTASGSLNGFSQGVTGALGRAFRLRATGRRGTTSNNLVLGTSFNVNLNSGITSSLISTTSPTTVDIWTPGVASTIYVGGRNTSGSGTGTALLDDFSLVEAWPFKGWTHNAVGIAIKATAPASAVADQVLYQADADTERDRIRIVRQVSDNHLVVVVTCSNSATATLDLGAVAGGEQFEVAISAAQNDFRASLNGGAVVGDSSGGLSGATHHREGRSLTGDTWTGTIERVTVF
jgi:hypothetical protein